MSPFYEGYEPTFELHSDDITGIQRIYDKYIDVNTINVRSPKDVDLCNTTKIDTIFTDHQGNTYIFIGKGGFNIFSCRTRTKSDRILHQRHAPL